MTEVMQGLALEAKKNKYSCIDTNLTDEDVVSVWDNVSAFIEKQMGQQKGVNITGLGTFTFTQKKLDVGNNKYILIQRPVFMLSEKFAQTHGLNYTKHHVAGQIPVVQLNFAALSFESPFDRDTVEACVKEVLGAVARSVGTKRNVEFVFQGIGRLQIRDSKVKMKFYKDFLNSMDGSGKLVDALKDRPGTVDSVMSNRSPSRGNGSNTVLLPRISHNGANQGMLTARDEGLDPGMPSIKEEDDELAALQTAREVGDRGDEYTGDNVAHECEDKQEKLVGRAGSRQAAPIAQATGVSFGDDLMIPSPSSPSGVKGMKASPTPMMMKRSLSPISSPNQPPPLTERPEFERSKSLDGIPIKRPESMQVLRFAPTPPGDGKPPSTAGSCGHSNAGQELCYLCHQRDRRNIPVSFAEERRKREMEEDRLLQQYQHMKDTEAILGEQGDLLGKRHDNQKMAAFNLGVSEAIKFKKYTRDLDFHPSYVFQKRPLTPPRFIKQEKYSNELGSQVQVKEDTTKKRKGDEEFLERLEQVQLAEDLAAQREQYLMDKLEQQEQYKRALSAQVRFKPLPIPARLPDSSSPVFGKNDMNVEKMGEKRQRAHDLYKDQLATVEQRKREAILNRLTDQKEESQMLRRTKTELLEDRADRYQRLFKTRKELESDWSKAHDSKRTRDLEERLLSCDPGELVHEQCDRYKRCGQCKRRTQNCGESNIWRESRYIPGSRLMV